MNVFWNKIKVSFLFTFFSLGIMAQNKDHMVRIAEVEIIPDYLEQYKAILKEEAEASIRLESGVIAIFPMFQKEHPNQIKILEIYANNEAYQSHLKTPHFLLYKTATLKMVKSLKLNDLEALDVETMAALFKKYK
jgi:quinol monooxygenase YgiN